MELRINRVLINRSRPVEIILFHRSFVLKETVPILFSGEWTENLRPLSQLPNLAVSLSMVTMHLMNSCVKNREMQVHNVD